MFEWQRGASFQTFVRTKKTSRSRRATRHEKLEMATRKNAKGEVRHNEGLWNVDKPATASCFLVFSVFYIFFPLRKVAILAIRCRSKVFLEGMRTMVGAYE